MCVYVTDAVTAVQDGLAPKCQLPHWGGAYSDSEGVRQEENLVALLLEFKTEIIYSKISLYRSKQNDSKNQFTDSSS